MATFFSELVFLLAKKETSQNYCVLGRDNKFELLTNDSQFFGKLGFSLASKIMLS